MGILQIKNFPDELKAKLAKRAKDDGTTMSAVVIDIVRRDLSLMTTSQWVDWAIEDMKNDRMIDTSGVVEAMRDDFERTGRLA